MSPPSPAQASKAAQRPGKTNSYRYFSRLSDRFLKPQAQPDSRHPPSPLLSQHSPSIPTQRLCSLRRKSSNYFATLARTLSSSPDPEPSERDPTSSGRDRQTQLAHKGGMGNQQSVSEPSDSVHTPNSKPENIGDPDTSVEGSEDTSTTMDKNPLDSVTAEVSLDDPPITGMKRPLPPPQSRNAVREEVKRAREVVDLCSDGEDAVPTAKRAKAGTTGVDDDELARSLSCSPKRMCNHIDDLREERLHPDLLRMAEVSNGSGDGVLDIGTGMQIGNSAAESSKIASETPERKKKKKLFGTLGATDLSVWANHQIPTANGNDAVLETPKTESHFAGISQGQDGPSEQVANGAAQPLADHGQDPSNKEGHGMFFDEGYSSFSVPGDDDADRVPEDEDELLKRIISLGDSSPFAQNSKAKVEKLVTPDQVKTELQQMKAKLQQKQEMAESKRRRQANIAAREQKSKQTAARGGGLSVEFLEDVEPRKDDVDRGATKSNGLSNGVVKLGHHKEHQALVNGSTPPSIKGQSQGSTLPAPKTKPAAMSHAAQLDFAEKWVQSSTGPNGAPRSAQRCSESAKSSGSAGTDNACAGLRGDRREGRNGFIRAPEQQLNAGGSGATETSVAYNLERRQGIISQLTPKRKKRQELSTPQQCLSNGQQESCYDQSLAETRLLELRNAPTSGKVSSVPKALPIVRQEGGLLDQLVRKKEQQMSRSAEDSVSEQGSQSPEAREKPKHVKKIHNRRAKRAVEAAEIVLLRMGVPAPVFKEWTDQRKCTWASREETITPKQVDFLAKCIKTYNILHNANQSLGSPVERRPDNVDVVPAGRSTASSPASPAQRLPEQHLGDNDAADEVNGKPLRTLSTVRKADKQSNERIAEAELVLQRMGLPPSQTADWSYQRKLAWAAEEAQIEKTKRKLNDFIAAGSETGRTRSALKSLAETQAETYEPNKHNAPAAIEDSDSDESEEEAGWQYAIRWQGTEPPTTPADTVPLNPIVAAAGVIPEESDSEGEEDEVEVSEVQPQWDPNPAVPPATTAIPQRYRNRQAPDEELLRQMQRRTLDDWNDEGEYEEVHEYVVKVDTWGMLSYPTYDLLILGSYLDRDKAEEMVRDFISNCKPKATVRSLEIQTVWSNGNFSQKMICDGEIGCRAFVEPKLVSACKYPDLTEKVARRKTYAVLFERTISKQKPDGDGELEEETEATTIDDLQVFTTKSLANEEAKKVYLGWYAGHLDKPQDKCWLLTADENLCKEVKELDEAGLLFERKDHIRKGMATDKIKVWVKEIAPKGPRN